MTTLLPLLLLLAAQEAPTTYLASIDGITLKPGERIARFSISTWGVRFKAVCHLPSGWRISAGSSAAQDGSLEGEGSHGVTWFDSGSPGELRDFVLVTLDGPVRQQEEGAAGSNVHVPATFTGIANIATADAEREEALTYRNVRLVPAGACPPQ